MYFNLNFFWPKMNKNNNNYNNHNINRVWHNWNKPSSSIKYALAISRRPQPQQNTNMMNDASKILLHCAKTTNCFCSNILSIFTVNLHLYHLFLAPSPSNLTRKSIGGAFAPPQIRNKSLIFYQFGRVKFPTWLPWIKQSLWFIFKIPCCYILFIQNSNHSRSSWRYQLWFSLAFNNILKMSPLFFLQSWFVPTALITAH